MTSKSAAHTVFATPELAITVFSSVAPHDLTRCIRVCKAWLQLAEPVLWANLTFEIGRYSTLQLETTTGLIRNLPHIREIQLSLFHYDLLWELAHGLPQDPQPGNSLIVPSTLCTNLRILVLYDTRDIPLPPLVSLLNHNHRLTHLTLPLIDYDIDDAILAAISRLRSLQLLHFDARGDTIKSNRTIVLLLQACLPLPHLTALFLDLDMDWDDEVKDSSVPDLEIIVKEASIARFSQNLAASKIRRLQLPTCKERSRNPPLFLMFESNLLDLSYCMIPYFSEDTRPEDVEQMVRKHCPGLKYLECRQFYDDGEDVRFVRAFIRGCSGLESFDSTYFSDRENGSFPDDDLPPGEARFIIRELIANHCNTLEEFELLSCLQVFSCDQQAVLSRCKRLRRFHVLAHVGDGSAGFEFTDATKSDWVCMELRELAMTLNRHPTHGDGELDPERMALIAKRFYAQIGRLEKLEELELTIDRSRDTAAKESDYAWDLTLSRGWLGEMAGLKNLRTLTLAIDLWSNMGQAEVEFIHDHWPLLSEIILNVDVWQMGKQPHWQWFSEQRPDFLLKSIG